MVYDQIILSILKQKFDCQLLNLTSTKLKETNSVKHRDGNACPRVINTVDSRPIHQYIRRNNETILKEIKEKFCQKDMRDQDRYQQLVVICIIMTMRSILPANTTMITDTTETTPYSMDNKSIKMMIGIVQDLQTNHRFTCLEIRFEDGRKIPKVKSNELRKIVKSFTYGEQSVSKALLVIRRLEQTSLVFILSILLNPIFYQVAQCSLNSGDDFNKIMTSKDTSGVAKEFIKNNVCELLECWANSSDLNPIENYWNVIKRRVEKRKPTNIDEMEQFMKEQIEKTDSNFVINFVNWMKDRCVACYFF